jgi:septal ring factor EnvC (AmiA/AmiB activator)
MSNDTDYRNGSSHVLIGGVLTLTITLLLGSYIYTWSETGRQDDEKQKWRGEHNQVLDKRFDEINKKQDKLEALVTNNNNKTQELLMELINSQHRTNEKIENINKQRGKKNE